MKTNNKHTPQTLGKYIINPDSTVIGKHGWRGETEHIVKPVMGVDNYLEIRISMDGVRKKWKLHKLICEVFHGPKPSKEHQVCHIDGNKLNNAAENLKWGTVKENAQDRAKHGKTSRGKRHSKTISEAIKKHRKNAALIAAAPEMFEILQLIGTIANVGLETNSDYKNRMKRISEHATEILKRARGNK